MPTTRNRALLEEWFERRKEKVDQREQQIDGLRDIAVARAAALHAMSNWLILGLLIASLVYLL
jgi:hypothetical protein